MQYKYGREELVEWYRQGKTKIFGEKYVPVLLCPPPIPHEMARDKTQTSAMGDQQLTTW